MAAERDFPTPKFLLPNVAQRPSGLWAPVDVELPQAAQVPDGLLPPPAPIALQRSVRTWHDRVGVYMTLDEIGFRPQPVSGIQADLSEVPFEPAMAVLAWLHRAAAWAGFDRERQFWLARRIFPEMLVGRVDGFIRRHERPAIVFEQQITALQRLAVLNCRPGTIDLEMRPEEAGALVRALISTPEAVVERPLTGARPGNRAMTREDFLRLFLSGAPFAHQEWLGGDIVRGYEMFEAIARTPEARKHQDWCDLGAWLEEAGWPSVRNLILAGMGLADRARAFDEDPELETRLVVPSFLDSLGDDGPAALRALSADRPWYRAHIASTQASAAHAARNQIAFHQRPYLRLENGSLLAVSGRAATAALSQQCLHYRLGDLAREKKCFSRYSGFAGWLYERYLVDVAERAHSRPRRSSGVDVFAAGRVHGEQIYKTGKGELRTPDVVVDGGLDLVVVEAAHRRLTIESLIDADVGAIERDFDKVGGKMRQLVDAITEITAGRAPIPGVEPTRIERVWPVVVLPSHLFQNEYVWAYLDRWYPPEFGTPPIQPLTLLETSDYEWLMAQVAEGFSLVEILRRKTRGAGQKRDLRSWFNDAPDALGAGESQFLGNLFGDTLELLAEPLKRHEAA